MSEYDETAEASAGGVKRRTILAGAAWTIPAMAVVSASPALAASGDVTLAFNRGAYSFAACGALADVAVTVSDSSGAPVPDSTLVVVTLPAGLTFEDGSRSKTVPTSGGRAVVPNIVAASGVGSYSITAATTDGAAAPVTATVRVDSAEAYNWNSYHRTPSRLGSVPASSTPVGGGYYLNGDDLYFTDGTLVATDVTSATGFVADGVNWVEYIARGDAYNWNALHRTISRLASVPAGSTPLGGGFYLHGTDLYFTDGTLVATNVSSAAGFFASGGTNWTEYISGGEVYNWNAFHRTPSRLGSVPASSTPVGGGYYLNGDDLYFSDGTLVATDVTSATGFVADGVNWVEYIARGDAYNWNALHRTISRLASVPAGSTPLGGGFYLHGTDLYFTDGTLVATNVASATGFYAVGNNWAEYVKLC